MDTNLNHAYGSQETDLEGNADKLSSLDSVKTLGTINRRINRQDRAITALDDSQQFNLSAFAAIQKKADNQAKQIRRLKINVGVHWFALTVIVGVYTYQNVMGV